MNTPSTQRDALADYWAFVDPQADVSRDMLLLYDRMYVPGQLFLGGIAYASTSGANSSLLPCLEQQGIASQSLPDGINASFAEFLRPPPFNALRPTDAVTEPDYRGLLQEYAPATDAPLETRLRHSYLSMEATAFYLFRTAFDENRHDELWATLMHATRLAAQLLLRLQWEFSRSCIACLDRIVSPHADLLPSWVSPAPRNTFEIVLDHFPSVPECVPVADVLAFRSDTTVRVHLIKLRRHLSSLSEETTSLVEAVQQIREDLFVFEQHLKLLTKERRARQLHAIFKIVSAMENTPSLLCSIPSRIATGVRIRRSGVSSLPGELDARGHQVALIYKARRHFGKFNR